jgi:hypothetical protein
MNAPQGRGYNIGLASPARVRLLESVLVTVFERQIPIRFVTRSLQPKSRSTMQKKQRNRIPP